jgi:hypothetical protein|tara:strand:+ start:91 stop:450 length:360 start_codon:yes stop_codon:yes gene_type:complete
MVRLRSIVVSSLFFLCVSTTVAQQVNYTYIILSPQKYLGKEVTKQGTFYYKNEERKSFDIKQRDNNIEIFYQLIPLTVQAAILGQKNFSKTLVTVKGTVKRFSNKDNSYYPMAQSISLK